jgi:hypothetical protein
MVGKRTHKILRPKIIRAVALAERRVFMADYTTVGGDPALVFAGIRTRMEVAFRRLHIFGACSFRFGFGVWSKSSLRHGLILFRQLGVC